MAAAGEGKRRICAGAIGLALALAGADAGAASPPPPEVFVSIGGGGVDSAAFKWSSALAQSLSRPPGLPRCDAGTPCGVPGVIAGAQTYDQPDTLLKALADGRIATGILSALRVYNARCAPPKGQGPAPISVLKTLYRQPLQLLLPANSAIRSPKDLSGKTLVVGERGSDSEAVALAMLDAYGIPRAKVKLARLPNDMAIAAMKGGTAQAALFVGHVTDTALGDLIARSGYTLLSIPDSPERRRLLQLLPVFEAGAISPAAYPTLPATSTLEQPVLWTAGPMLDPALAEQLVAGASEPHNAARLSELVDPVAAVPESEAFLRLAAPPAEGAVRFAASAHLPVSVVDCPAQTVPAAGVLKGPHPTP